MKRVAVFLIAVGVLFAAVTLLKRGPSAQPNGTDSTSLSASDRDRLRRFWEVYRRAVEHRMAGRSADAAEEYSRALALNPGHQDALYYMGNMYFDLGNDAAAERAWRRLVEIDPTSARAHSQLGTLYFCVGDPQRLQPRRAAAEFERASAINREETGPLLHLGEIALVEGDLELARSYFDAVVGSNYASAEAHFYKGYIAWKQGAFDRSAELLAAATHHARPAERTQGVPGEGDTRAGPASMVPIPSRCQAMQALVDSLSRVEGDGSRLVETVYPRFAAFLQDVRTKLPS